MEKLERKLSKQERASLLEKMCLEIFNLSKTELKTLEERVAKFGGHVRCVMHPLSLMGSHADIVDPDSIPKQVAHFAKIFKQSVKSEGELVPTFVFLENGSQENERQFLESFGHGLERNGLYILYTETDKGRPGEEILSAGEKTLPIFKPDFKKLSEKEKAWFSLLAAFSIVGVKSVTVSGGFVDAVEVGKEVEEEINRKIFLDRCLGNLIEQLRLYNFKVDISNSVVYRGGYSREKIKESGAVLKETGKKNT